MVCASSGRGTTPIALSAADDAAARSNRREQLRVCLDADVLFAGAASVTGASHALLQLGELGVIDVRVAQQALDEAERNLRAKLPAALPAYRTLVSLCTMPIPMPSPTAATRLARSGDADPKDAPILAAALAAHCRWLVTFNVRDYPTHRIRVTEPGAFIEELRARLAAEG